MQFRPCARTVALLTTVCLGLACSKKGPAPKIMQAKAPAFFTEAAANRGELVGTVIIPSVGGTITKLSGIANKLQLPADAAALRSLVVGPLKLPEVVWTHLDESKPIALAMMTGVNEAASPTAVAAEAKSDKDAQALVAALGQKVETREGAIRVKRPDETEVWLYVDGEDILGSETFLGLKRGGAHALAARQKVEEDIIGTIYPEAIAKAGGTTVEGFVTDTRKQMMDALRAQAATTPSPMPVEVTEKLIDALITPYLRDVGETKTVDVALLVSDKAGLRLRGRAHPKADSAFAGRLAKVVPYELHPALKSAASPAGLFAVGYSRDTLQRYREATTALAAVDLPGVQNMAAGMAKMLDLMGTSYSAQASVVDGLSYSFVSDLAEGADPNAVMDALEMAFGPKGMGLLMKQDAAGGKGRGKIKTPPLVWKRQGTTARLEMPLTVAGADKQVQKQMQQMFGGKSLVYTFAVADNKFIGVVHPQPEAELARLMKATEGSVHPAVQSALEATKGSEAFFYFDVLGFMRPFIQAAAGSDPSMAQANAMMRMVPALATMNLPIVFSYKGGEAMTGELSLPMGTLENVAELARPFMGMFGAGAAGPAPSGGDTP